MPNRIESNEDFTSMVLSNASATLPSEPRVFYNEDGDCIEILFTNESYYAERIDKLVTVYYGRDSGEIVGSVIKGVKRFIKNVLKSQPGFAIEIRDGRIRLEHIFTAEMWSHCDNISVTTYEKLRSVADEYHLEVDVPAYA